jgi:hypothetical protein
MSRQTNVSRKPSRAERRTNGLLQFGQRCLRSPDSSVIIAQSSMLRRGCSLAAIFIA